MVGPEGDILLITSFVSYGLLVAYMLLLPHFKDRVTLGKEKLIFIVDNYPMYHHIIVFIVVQVRGSALSQLWQEPLCRC